MKVFIFPGFDLDNFREANPHLRVDLIDAESATPYCVIRTKRYGPRTNGRNRIKGECIECDATFDGKTKAIRLGWQIDPRWSLCPRHAK